MRLTFAFVAMLVMSFAEPVSAATVGSFDCTQASRARLELYAHARNVLNARVTRTPEGTAPKRLWVVCEKGTGDCNIEFSSETRLVYEPDHPDAMPTGYVTYANINLALEKAAFNLKVTELRSLANRKFCGMSVNDLGSAAMIFFPMAIGGGSEIFNFFPEGSVVSWMHDDTRTKHLLVNFAQNGDVVDLHANEGSERL